SSLVVARRAFRYGAQSLPSATNAVRSAAGFRPELRGGAQHRENVVGKAALATPPGGRDGFAGTAGPNNSLGPLPGEQRQHVVGMSRRLDVPHHLLDRPVRSDHEG